MRVALSISGELRNFSNQILIDRFNKYIVEDLKPDVFISTWDHLGFSIHNSQHYLDSIPKSFDEKKIYEVYKNIKGLTIDNFDNWISENETIPVVKAYLNWKLNSNINYNCATSVPQFYLLHKCYTMINNYEIENNFKYDVIIKMRPDLFFTNNIKKPIETNTIYHCNYGPGGWHHPHRIYDIFFYSDSTTFKVLGNIWNDLESLFNDPWVDERGNYDATKNLYLLAMKNNIRIESVNRRICEVYRNETPDEFHLYVTENDKKE
jgi:hypothetical protein